MGEMANITLNEMGDLESIWQDAEAAKAYESLESVTFYCRKCDGTLTLMNGRYGLFYGCSNFPKCTGSLSVAYGMCKTSFLKRWWRALVRKVQRSKC
jgi:ssDNA-binding Zn-finger/Zn-ribbon topoisomerase 1